MLTDVQMPEMDGLEATAAIREKEKTTRLRQAVVALTAHAMKGDREKCMASGMDGYLTKPIRPPGTGRVAGDLPSATHGGAKPNGTRGGQSMKVAT